MPEIDNEKEEQRKPEHSKTHRSNTVTGVPPETLRKRMVLPCRGTSLSDKKTQPPKTLLDSGYTPTGGPQAHCLAQHAKHESLSPNPTPYTLYPTPDTLHPSPYTLHRAPYTLHPTAKTLHPTPYTLHPTPYTHHVVWPAAFIIK